MTGYVLLLAWMVTALFAVATNRDIFSPVKMYLFTLALYFANIFVTPYPFPVTSVYFALLVTGVLLSIQEGSIPSPRQLQGTDHLLLTHQLRITGRMLWLLSVIPLAAQLYLIRLMGGFTGFVSSLGNRVVEYRGLGAVSMLIAVFPVINIVYFAVGLLGRRVPLRWWMGYCLHLGILVLVGLASGSRGLLLTNFMLMIVTFHYLKRRVSVAAACIAAVALIAAASIVGVARNGYKAGEEGIQTGLDNAETIFQSNEFSYGLMPLELVFSRPPADLEYGRTFLTVFSNVVPRSVWPSKPDTGGVVLTKKYTDDAWDGATYLSTGLIAESILNFGWSCGVPIGFLLVWLSMQYSLTNYYNVFGKRTQIEGIVLVRRVLSHVVIMTTVTSLLLGEFTASVMTAVIARLLPLACITKLCSWMGGSELERTPILLSSARRSKTRSRGSERELQAGRMC